MKGCTRKEEEDGRLRVEEEEVGVREQVGRMKELRLPSGSLFPSHSLVRPPAFVSFLAPSSHLPLTVSFIPLLFPPASSLAPFFSLIKVIGNQFIIKFIICT